MVFVAAFANTIPSPALPLKGREKSAASLEVEGEKRGLR